MSDETSTGMRKWWPAVGVLMGVCLLMRMSRLGVLPVFGDEAIYLRWAQLVKGGEWWVSLADPKPPLHFWMIAAVMGVVKDPLMGARMISVLAGVAAVPLLFLIGMELGNKSRLSGAVWGFLGVILVLFSPFFGFYQRLATADSLFATESLAVVWLSLLWGRTGSWRSAVGLGVAVGLGLMTRQGLSYTLCVMPFVGWAVGSRGAVGKRLLQTAVAVAIAGAIWVPYLAVQVERRALITRQEADGPEAVLQPGDVAKEVKRRVLYQEKFTEGASKWAVAKRNTALAFVPTVDKAGEPASGWLFYYLTPPVYVLVLAGCVYLIIRREWRAVLVLGVWAAATLWPVIVLGNVVFSRYVLAGTLPLMLAGAYLLGDGLSVLFARMSRADGGARPAAWGVTAVVMVGMFGMGFAELGRQATQWWKQTLTVKDKYQYVSGWTAGLGTQRAVAFLRGLAREGPLVVITGNEWGTPADAVWVALSGEKNVRLFYTDQEEILQAGPRGGVMLRESKWGFPPYREVELGKGVPVVYVTQRMRGDREAAESLKEQNPRMRVVEMFQGTGEEKDGDVVVFSCPR